MEHVYIDGTTLEANAQKYTWVWKKSSIKSRNKEFCKLTELINEINVQIMAVYRVKCETGQEYCVEYVESMLETYLDAIGLTTAEFVRGSGKRKSIEQKLYETVSLCREAHRCV